MTTLYPYQKQGARNIHRWGGRALLADDMGLGKTIQSLYWLKKNPSKRPCIIVCPASVKWNWQREAAEHFGMYSEVLSGTKPSQEGLGNIAPLLILNYDILPKWTPYLLQIDPQVLILDEIHYLKTRTTRS
jgi:SWI/SNF-related matrix-associated actin-dependent regulator 1 of chromatin subfamily A